MLYKVGYYVDGDESVIRYVYKSYDLASCFEFVGGVNSCEEFYVFDESDNIVNDTMFNSMQISLDTHGTII